LDGRIKNSDTIKKGIAGDKVTVEQEILRTLEALIPGVTAVKLIEATMGALRKLPSESEKVKLFERASHSEYAANFQASTSYKTDEGAETALCIICLSSGSCTCLIELAP
jgi:hypothetical protein